MEQVWQNASFSHLHQNVAIFQICFFSVGVIGDQLSCWLCYLL